MSWLLAFCRLVVFVNAETVTCVPGATVSRKVLKSICDGAFTGTVTSVLFGMVSDISSPHTTLFVARSTCVMSLCKMACSPRLSHFTVTPAQFVSVTVPWSAWSFCQQTRSPIFNRLDWSPFFRPTRNCLRYREALFVPLRRLIDCPPSGNYCIRLGFSLASFCSVAD
jgi:hypothetical protein